MDRGDYWQWVPGSIILLQMPPHVDSRPRNTHLRLRLVALLLFVLASLLVIDFRPTSLAQSVDPLAKIAPWVLEHTDAKQDAEFLVVLADQADLRGAAPLQTKEEKGRFVYSALYSKAQTTQKPLLNWLQANGIQHRSFYIVNMILVKGDETSF